MGDGVFYVDIFGDNFNYIFFVELSGKVWVCYNEFCCKVIYIFCDNFIEMFVFGVFDGLYIKEGIYYI